MIISKIREKTLSYHDEFTGWATNILNGSITLENYTKVLKVFYGFYLPLEQKILTFNEFENYAFDFKKRSKLGLLIEDLNSVGITDLNDIDFCKNLPELNTLAQVLGCMYVIEGATLGGQIVGQKLNENFKFDNEKGGSKFFHSYKENVRPFWKEFMDFINDYSEKNNIEEPIIESAHQTYQSFNKWLSQLKGISY